MKTAATFLALCISGNAFAEIFLKDNSEIVGPWTLEFVAATLNSAKTDENRTWEFKADGTLVSSGYNRVLKIDDKMSFGYKVENGKILLTDPGRPHKPQTYEVYEKTGNSMILKGGSEGFYFFKKK
ncbi:hypothetical protein [Methylogaea oryzae]|uniref:Lipocalin-like domain-containing protein n=1 Tax=Methylogaea oryzae TaxID=1295382 RepID=A0A8D4VP20_9GAMM|nr:hypothetical protein [Methylogaea oryzae]BBL71062.1 hypothetical protein MoryE10_16680 [Methylogaea oryzae]